MSFLEPLVEPIITPLIIGQAVGRAMQPSVPSYPAGQAQPVLPQPAEPAAMPTPTTMPAPVAQPAPASKPASAAAQQEKIGARAENVAATPGETTVGTEAAVKGTPSRRKRKGRAATILTEALGGQAEYLG